MLAFVEQAWAVSGEMPDGEGDRRAGLPSAGSSRLPDALCGTAGP
jgi:hypothetical protein